MQAEAEKQISAEDAGDGNIDKIRDILFGVQIREFDGKLTRLEENFSNRISAARDETQRRLEALEGFIKTELKALGDRLKGEQSVRSDSISEVNIELKKLSTSLERKTVEIVEHLARSESELRDQLLSQSKSLTNEIQARNRDITATLDRQVSELRDTKTDRRAMADLLNEMAMRLTDDFKLPKEFKK
jgi:uncharacterized membrane-anchored protein YhcB (DUF1043 family)